MSHTNNTEHTQLEILEEFNVYETPILAGTAHMGEMIALKHVCQNLGLDWSYIHQRLQRNKNLFQLCVKCRQISTDGKNYDMVCLPPLAFQEWLKSLASVDSDNLDKDLLNKYLTDLVIQLLLMLKVSLDENERLRGLEQTFNELAIENREIQKLQEQEEELKSSIQQFQSDLTQCKKDQKKYQESMNNRISNQLNLFHGN